MRKGGKKPWRKGFTLAECLVVVSIITVLLAVAIPNVIAYYRALKLTELDDSARTIFVAAQNRLSAMLASGEKLESLSTDKVDLHNPTGTAGGKYLYLEKTAGVDKSAELGSVLPGGSIENQLDKWNYVVEFDPKTGAVYAVWYWEKGSFNYATEAYAGVTPDKDQRLKDHRMVGYYGGTRIKRTEINQLPFPEVTLINAEELRLNITLPDREGLTDDNFRVDVKVNGVEILKDANIWAGEDHSYAVVLDTLKGEGTYGDDTSMGSPDWVFGHQFKKWGLWRFDVWPGDDITVSVTLRYNDGSGSVTYLPNTQYVKSNSLFAALRDGGSTAEIVYGRHLQNLNSTNSRNLGDPKTKITGAVQIRDINFALKNPTGNTENDIYYWASTYPEANDPGYRAFAPIRDRVDYDGQSLPIRSLYSKSSGGLFGVVDNGTGTAVEWKNIVLIDTKVNTIYNDVGALAGGVENVSITNCQVYLENPMPYDAANPDASIEPQLQSTTNIIGGLVGFVQGPNNSITDSFAATVVSGLYDVGGLVGWMSDGSTLTVTRSYAACHLTATVSNYDASVSGLVNTSHSNVNLTVTNCYAAGVIAGGNSVAGLVNRGARSSGTTIIKDSYAAVRYGNALRDTDQVFGTVGQNTTGVSGDHVYYVAQSGIDYKDSFGTKVTTKELSEMPATGAAGVDPDAKTLGGDWYHLPAEKEGETPPTNPLGAAFPYNQTEETAELLAPYPYPQLAVKDPEDPAKTLPMLHYGDWLESEAKGQLVYWERLYGEDENTYYFYDGRSDADSVNCLPGANQGIVCADGYGILLPAGSAVPKVTTYNTTYISGTTAYDLTPKPSSKKEMNLGGTSYDFYDLSDAISKLDTAFVNFSDYYNKIEIGEAVFWFNPDFACEVFADADKPSDLDEPAVKKLVQDDKTIRLTENNKLRRVVIRSARQLVNLSAYNIGRFLGTYAAYQWMDIDFSKYEGTLKGQKPEDRFYPLKLNWTTTYGGAYTCWGFDTQDGKITSEGKEEVREVRNLYIGGGVEIRTSGYNGAGFFSEIDNGAQVKNLHLVNVSVVGDKNDYYVGGLAAVARSNSKIENCSVYVDSAENYDNFVIESHSTSAYSYTGGLVGLLGDSNGTSNHVTVNGCFAAVKVSSEKGRAGGFAGHLDNANITDCYSGGHTVGGEYDDTKPNVEGGEEGVGGFAGMAGPNAKISGVCYSTCSVRAKGETNYLGAFIGYPRNFAGPQSDATVYATGEAVNSASPLRDEDYLGDLNMITQATGFDTRPYDDVLKDMTYPYKTNLSAHYGDWPLLKPMLVYYEKYNDGTYGYYSVTCKGTTFTDTLNTLHVGTPGDGVTVVEDGYRFLAPFDMDLGGGATVKEDGDFPTVVNGCVAYKIEGLTIESLAGYGGSDSPGRYRRSEWISADFTYGGKKYVFWCNPCYACEAFDMTEAAQSVSNSGQTQKVNIRYIDKTTGSETTRAFSWGSKIIRSPRHLGMATIDPDNGGNRTWYQLLDIDYAKYTAPLPYGEAKKGTNTTTVGQTKETPQRPLCLGYLKPLQNSEYYGNRYLIKNLYIEPCEEKAEGATSDDYFEISAGVFTIQNGCTVDGVRLVNVNVTGTDNVGGLAGACEDNGKIIDCGIYVDSADDYEKFTVTGAGDNVGGLVGYLFKNNLAECPVKNSFAAVKVTGKNYVGGLVGRAENKAVITDCYAGGHTVDGEYVGADANVTGNDYVGGLLGYVTINRTNYTNGAKIISSYSTASVKATAASPAHLGALIGDGPTTYGYDYDNNTMNFVYARNRVFNNDGDVVEGRPEPYLEAVKDVLRTADYQKAAYPYDNTLGDKFPYSTRLTEHHGDWLAPPTGQLVYWEGYAKGTGDFSYNFYGGENSDINCLLGTEHGSVSRDGYGILVPAGKEVPEVFVYDYDNSGPLKLELLSENENIRGKNYDLYGFKLPMNMRNNLRVITNNYYHEIYVGAEKLWFNPDFACEVFATQPADLTKPAPKTLTEYRTAIPLTGGERGYVIRSARQLVNKGKYGGLYDKIFQWMDIDFATYDAGTVRFYDTPVDGQSADLRYSHPMRLLSGGAYTCWGFNTSGSRISSGGQEEVRVIRNLYIGDQTQGSYVNAMGLFDQVGYSDAANPAIVKNLHLVNVDVVGNGSKDSDVGGLAGSVSGAARIENCGIYVSSAENYEKFTIRGDFDGPRSQSVGGLFGEISWDSNVDARPVVENCFAAVKVVSVEQSGSAGGFAGHAAYCTIKNCYSGGHTENGKYVDTARTDANVAATGLYSSGAGGLVGTSRYATFEGVCYSTCSVYCNHYEDDRMGAFIGHAYTDPTLAPGATVYATGKAVGSSYSLREEDYLSPALITELTSGQADATATKYDTTLGNTYPYQAAAGQTVHHGDWYVPDISAAFYWEKEQVYSWNGTKWVAEGEPEYHYHLMGVSEMSELENKYHDVNTLCTERHDDGKIHQIDHYGYGVLTTGDGTQTRAWGGESCGMMSPVTSSFTTDEIAVKALIEKELGASTKYFGVYQCDKALSHEYNQYMYNLSIPGASTRTVYFTIDFADLYLTEKKDGRETFTIRSARQLDNIFNGKTNTYNQDHDVGAVNYNGYTAPDIRNITYNGKYYRILELSINSSDDVALFKIARGTNKLENMVLYSPSGKARIEATNDQKAAGGLIAYLDIGAGYNTTIENCAVAGYTFYTPRNTAGGLVGYANHDLTIRNCEAVNTFHRRDNDSLSWNNPLGIGGLVGPVGNGYDAYPSLTIENSYAGGVITGNSTLGSVGGLYGGGRAPNGGTIRNAYSYMDLSSCWMDTSNLSSTERETVNARKEVNTIGHGATATGSSLYYYNKSSYLPSYYVNDYIKQGTGESNLGTISSIGGQPVKSYVPGSDGLTDLGSQTGLKAVVQDADGNYVHYGVLPR